MWSRIRPFEDRDADTLVDLSLRAWAPDLASFGRTLGSEIFRRVHPETARGREGRRLRGCRDL
jgi:hypothetical protein